MSRVAGRLAGRLDEVVDAPVAPEDVAAWLAEHGLRLGRPVVPDERISVSMSAPTAAVLERLMMASGRSRSDVIARALRLAAFVDGLADGESLAVRRADGTIEGVHLL